MALHQSHKCQRFGDWTARTGNCNGSSCNRIVEIGNQSGGSDDWIVDNHSRIGIFGDRTTNTRRQKGIFSH